MPQETSTARILGFPRTFEEEDVFSEGAAGNEGLLGSANPREPEEVLPARDGDPSSMTNERKEPGGEAVGAGKRGLSRAAFQHLYEKEYDQVCGFFSRRRMGEEDPEDLAHDTFVRAWKSRSSYRGDSSELTWLFGIAQNVLYKSRRHHGADRRRPSPGVVAALVELYQRQGASGANAAFEAVASKERRRSLLEGIETLKGAQRDCLRLLVLQGRPYKEIAAILGLRLSQVSSHIRLGKKNLEKLLRS